MNTVGVESGKSSEISEKPEWRDSDGDGIPNDEDPDDDNDGVPDTQDAFPFDPTESKDTDGDGLGDNADSDDDNDGRLDDVDNCPLIANPDQRDTDGDGTGDACDPDTPLPELKAAAVCGERSAHATLPIRLTQQGYAVASTGFTLTFPTAQWVCEEAGQRPTVHCATAVQAQGFSCTGQVNCAAGAVQVTVTPPSVIPVPPLPEGDIVEILFTIDPLAPTGQAPLCSAQPPECTALTFTALDCSDPSGVNIPCRAQGGCLDVLSCQQGDCNGDGKVTTADVTCTILRLFNAMAQVSACEDCNGDGKLTTADVTCGILCLFGQCPAKP